MRSTLFVIPHELAGVPLLGFGWLLGAIVVACLGWIGFSLVRKQPLNEILAALPVWLIAAAIVAFVMPGVEQKLPNGAPLGLPIRGYGVMVLLGLLAGIGITVHRGSQLGISSDHVIGLGFWMMLGGVVGARTFYVVQKWDEFAYLEGVQRLIHIVKLTEGGLVIYGGVLGGLVAGAMYCRRHQMPIAATADLIAPGFLLGLAFGRIGCLLHGCCFGGVCTASLPAIVFPESAGAYASQLHSGRLLGIGLESPQPPARILRVDPDSPAELEGLEPGQLVESIEVNWWRPAAEGDSASVEPQLRADLMVDGRRVTIMPSDLPHRSLPVHPTQIYASINAVLLCILIWFLQPLTARDGVAFLIAIVLYALSRFLLEGVRSDEAGQLGTALSISQWVSVVGGSVAAAGLWGLSRMPPRRAWNWGSLAEVG